jgi:hypothetical protein
MNHIASNQTGGGKEEGLESLPLTKIEKQGRLEDGRSEVSQVLLLSSPTPPVPEA